MIRNVVRVFLVAFLVLPLTSCGKARANPLLYGTWEIREKGKQCTVEFTKDGKVRLSGSTSLLRDFQFAKLLADFDMQPAANTPITCKAVGEKELEIEGDFSALLGPLSSGAGDVSPEKLKNAQEMLHPQERVTYAVAEKELTLTSSTGKAITLKRME